MQSPLWRIAVPRNGHQRLKRARMQSGDFATLVTALQMLAQVRKAHGKDFETAHFLDGFETPDRRFHFSPDWSRLGNINGPLPEYPDHFAIVDKSSAEKPFRMVTAPARHFLNSSFTETVTSARREGRPTAKIHSKTCAGLKLASGDRVRIGNEQASVVVHVEPYDDLLPDVVIVESIWPSKSFIEGVGINALISSDPGRGIGGAVFHDTAVWLRKDVD